MSTVMFNEDLQDLKDRYRDRLTMIHVLSRQAQEVDLLQGRIDGAKVRAIIDALLPVGSMDEVFICGPDEMITATETALVEAGVPADRIRTERFTANLPAGAHPVGASSTAEAAAAATKDITMVLVLDGKEHEIAIGPDEHLLDAGLNAGLDLPFSCKAGVCCTCRAKVHGGRGRDGQELHPRGGRGRTGLRAELPGARHHQAPEDQLRRALTRPAGRTASARPRQPSDGRLDGRFPCRTGTRPATAP